MATRRQGRRIQNGVFAAFFFIAAVGFLVLVWMSVRGIPQDEASRVGWLQFKLLKSARSQIKSRISRIMFLHHHVLARLPHMAEKNPSDDPPELTAALTELQNDILRGEDSWILRRYSEGPDNQIEIKTISPGQRSLLAQAVENPDLSELKSDGQLDKNFRIRELIGQARKHDRDPQWPSAFGAPFEKGRGVLTFTAPIFQQTSGKRQFVGALCLFVSTTALLRSDSDSERWDHVRPQSYGFVLSESVRGQPAGLPRLLWHSEGAQDDTGAREPSEWQKAFVSTIESRQGDGLRDPSLRWSMIAAPTRTDSTRLEVM
jgi:hypothetical protein